MERENLVKTILEAISNRANCEGKKISSDVFLSVAFMSDKNLKKLYKQMTGKSLVD